MYHKNSIRSGQRQPDFRCLKTRPKHPFVSRKGYSGTSQIRTSRIRLPPQYDRFFIDGLFFLLCLTKSYLPNKITSQTRYTMMKIGRNTIGHNFLSKKKSYLRVNYRQIDHDGVDLSDFRGLCPPFC